MSTINIGKAVAGLTLATAIAVPTMLPTDAMAVQSHRQKSKNQWRNLGIAGAVLGGYGLLSHNNTLAALGLGGGAYSAYRYEQDRKSQSRERDRWNHRRAERFYGHRHPVVHYRHRHH